MAKLIDKEIEAIKAVLAALDPIDGNARKSVLDYVIQRLDIKLRIKDDVPPPPPGEPPPTLGENEGSQQLHIKDLVTQKQPRSAIEMATIVAYYLLHKAPPSERRKTITTKDIETYFQIADFKLPSKPEFTLPNTKAAGYVDVVDRGEYKLNPVGYNLVVHSMPKDKKSRSWKPRRQKGTSGKKNIKSKK